jgi:hypothetical protein
MNIHMAEVVDRESHFPTQSQRRLDLTIIATASARTTMQIQQM